MIQGDVTKFETGDQKWVTQYDKCVESVCLFEPQLSLFAAVDRRYVYFVVTFYRDSIKLENPY